MCFRPSVDYLSLFNCSINSTVNSANNLILDSFLLERFLNRFLFFLCCSPSLSPSHSSPTLPLHHSQFPYFSPPPTLPHTLSPSQVLSRHNFLSFFVSFSLSLFLTLLQVLTVSRPHKFFGISHSLSNSLANLILSNFHLSY